MTFQKQHPLKVSDLASGIKLYFYGILLFFPQAITGVFAKQYNRVLFCVLLKELADEFYNTFNGQPYNLIEDEVKE